MLRHPSPAWVSGCKKYQAVRHEEWNETGILNKMRPATSLEGTYRQSRLKTD